MIIMYSRDKVPREDTNAIDRKNLVKLVSDVLIRILSERPPSEVRSIIETFVNGFEKTIRPSFEREVIGYDRRPDQVRPTDIISLFEYIKWISGFISKLGVQTETEQNGTFALIKLRECIWPKGNADLGLLCPFCLSVISRSFSWTLLDGRIYSRSTIAEGANRCTFEIIYQTVPVMIE